MRKIKKYLSVGLVFIFLASPVFAFDWIDLHNQAGDLTIKQAKEMVGQDFDSIEDLYLLALVYLEKYQVEPAQDLFEKINKMDPDNLPARWGRAEILRRKHECNGCKDKLAEIIKEAPGFAPAYITLAYINYKNIELDQAARLTYEVIRMGQGNVDQLNYVRALALFAGAKGMTAHYGGPLSKVINGRLVKPYLLRAKRVDSSSAVVKFGLGSYYLLAPGIFGRDLDKAKDYLKRAIEADPNFADVYVRLAQVYKAKEELDKYNQLLEKALTLDPKNNLALDIKQETCRFICVD